MTTDAERYSIETHKHLYAIWCAARAYGRGLTGGGNSTAQALIEASGLRNVVSPDDIGQDVDAWLHAFMDRIMVKAEELGLEDFSFGHAQKLVNIYLKTVLVCGGHHDHQLVARLHPPLDRELFRGLRAYLRKNPANPGKRAFIDAQAANDNWTTFNETDYRAHIEAIKLIMGSMPLFMVEEHWRL